MRILEYHGKVLLFENLKPKNLCQSHIKEKVLYLGYFFPQSFVILKLFFFFFKVKTTVTTAAGRTGTMRTTAPTIK